MQPTQFFFPLSYGVSSNLDIAHYKKIIDVKDYTGTNKLNHRITVPFIWNNDRQYKGSSTPYILDINTDVNDVYYQTERLTDVDCFSVDVINFYTETLDLFEFNDNVFIPSLTPEKLQARYNQCQVIDPEERILLDKPLFENISTTPYLWTRYSGESKELEFDDDSNILLNGIKYERSFEIPTLHKIKKLTYHFKPTLEEVLSQLPNYLDEPFLVTTEMLSSDIDIIVQGNYHIGITTVYTPVIEQDNKRHCTDYDCDNTTF